MSLIIDTIYQFLPAKRKSSPSGWISFNAVCCMHNGERNDSKQRGGVFIKDHTVSYHCFNCGFKTSWQPGWQLTHKFKKLLEWLDVPTDLITKCGFESLKLKNEEQSHIHTNLIPTFFTRALPREAKKITDYTTKGLPTNKLLPIIDYLNNRAFSLNDYPWYWSDQDGFNDRLIIPFYYQNKIVGWTARTYYQNKKIPKYISEQQPGYVFNLDNQTMDKKFALLTEGPLDAISINGIAVMTNEINTQQKYLIDSLKKEIILVPDRDLPGKKLVEQAIEYDWSVSFPPWIPEIKDINDAVKYYGKLTTMWNIINYKETNKLKIQLKMKSWF